MTYIDRTEPEQRLAECTVVKPTVTLKTRIGDFSKVEIDMFNLDQREFPISFKIMLSCMKCSST